MILRYLLERTQGTHRHTRTHHSATRGARGGGGLEVGVSVVAVVVIVVAASRLEHHGE